ncbi:MAG TPA: site-specific DNA-methyltransferase [Chthonomonadaceae bacterium]|nr:site-specific DNA-methyltransferase [Chthonomonadaceae bacterium]
MTTPAAEHRPQAMATSGNTLYQGDNLAVLRAFVPDGSVALIYLDPPFASQRDYPLHAGVEQNGGRGARRAFSDVWEWDEAAYAALLQERPGEALTGLLRAFVEARRRDALAAYLVMMLPRLVELYRVLAPTGSCYLHCDPAASHYLKALLDALFGAENFRREIVWRSGWVSGYKARAKNWVRNHDTLLYYVKDRRRFTFDMSARFRPHPPDYRRRGGGGNPQGVPLDDVWDDPALYSPWIKSFSTEKCGYATQKPLALLERILRVSSAPGDLILDPCCGGGTTLLAAHTLARRWIGIDRSAQAIALTRQRLDRAGLGDYAFHTEEAAL